VFAGDHGIANDGVSSYPQEVTYQMCMNFLGGGGAINVFCRQNNIAIKIVDAGVNYKFPDDLPIVNAKVGMGTNSFLRGPAMSASQLQSCFEKGSAVVAGIYKKTGSNVIGFGEMGIGNTSSASAIMSALCNIPVAECVGKGAGLDQTGLQKKIDILKKALRRNKKTNTVYDILAEYGGFEIVQMCAAMLQAAERKMLILVDGFIATSAFLAAQAICPPVIDYALFCHVSDEAGHAKMLKYLGVKPLLQLSLRLGEGTGCAIGYPIVLSSVNFLNEMASFESAGVSNKE
jgi:nicotinate-nucleotide--dimethylbenzimidazole phosphoribosyltransferase